jgi:hypothetical protein
VIERVRFVTAALFLAAVAALSAYHLVQGTWSGLLRRRIAREAGIQDTGWAAVRQGLLRILVGILGLALVSGVSLWWWFRVRGAR